MTGTSTGQTAIGEATILGLSSSANLMAWSGTDGNHTVNVATSASLTFGQGPLGLLGNASAQLDGPAVVIMPNGIAGYVIWVNSAGVIEIASLSLSNATVPAVTVGANWTVSGSKPAGPPAASFGIQNSALVVNIVWQDSGLGAMALCQLQVGNEASSLAFNTLLPVGEANQSCKGSPSLASTGGTTILAWTGTNGEVNFATDPTGGVDFSSILTTSLASAAGSTFIPLGLTLGYLLYSTTPSAGIAYQQIGVNQSGEWQINPATGCSGTIACSPNGGPNGFFTSGANPTVTVVWADTSQQNAILYSTFVPSFAPIPIG